MTVDESRRRAHFSLWGRVIIALAVGVVMALAWAWYQSYLFEKDLAEAFRSLAVHVDRAPVDWNDMQAEITTRPVIYLAIIAVVVAIGVFLPGIARTVRRASQ